MASTSPLKIRVTQDSDMMKVETGYPKSTPQKEVNKKIKPNQKRQN